MTDVRIVQRTDFPRVSIALDWSLLASGGLDESDALATAIIVAMSTDGLARETDVLPDPNSHDRKGWWGDLDAEEIWGGWPIGSRLYLLKRAKITDSAAKQGSTVSQVESYLRECLQPFVTAGIVSSYALLVERNTQDRQRIDAGVTLFRGPRSPVKLQFQILWDEMGLSISVV